MRLPLGLAAPLFLAFSVLGAEDAPPLKIVAYGDVRFTSGLNVSNPKIRVWLVNQIATEKPEGIFVSGDIPFRGGSESDWSVYQSESAPWRQAKLHVYPALGNHEMTSTFLGSCGDVCLKNWWHAFPELEGKRWYSTRLGPVFALTLDSTSPLIPTSEQYKWFEEQLAHPPPDIRFLLVNMHHPPVADVQIHGEPGHNPRANEQSIIPLLKEFARQSHVRVLVVAGHVHNYERRQQDGVMYVVSGGGGATPRHVNRTSGDFYARTDEPNYHYLRITVQDNKLDAVMIRVKDIGASRAEWEEADHFQLVYEPLNAVSH